jgi:23S rRNA pseudouridine1911/1915/1917 synthase
LNQFKFSAPTEWIGLRLDKALSLHEQVKTRNKAQWLLENNLVLVNRKQVKPSHKISATDEILIQLPDPKPSDLIPLHQALDIKYEDEDLIVINKPSGLVVHPAAGHEQDTLVNMLLAHSKNLSMRFGEQRPGIVHRIDRDTSGLLVVAKNDQAHEALAQQFKNKSVERVYWAITVGRPPKTSDRIVTTLARHPTDRKKFASTKNPQLGKVAITNYQVLKSTSNFSAIQLKLETGRTHQIRVHLKELGCPILSDPIYQSKKTKTDFHRLALHACVLGFVHPKTHQQKRFFQPWPTEENQKLKEMGFVFENTFGI